MKAPEFCSSTAMVRSILVVGARNLGRVDVDGAEEAQALQADLRAVDRGLRVPGTLELAHFTAQHVVARVHVALEHDLAHVHALAGHDEEVEADLALLLVDRRDRLHFGERVADVGQRRGDRVDRLLDLLAREGVADLDLHQLAQVVLVEDEGAGQLDVVDLVDLAFGDVGDDVHLALVRTDADLGRIDVEVGVAAVHVVGLQLLQVAGKLLLRVLVVLGVPRGPVRRVRLELALDVLVGERLVADDVEVLDARRLAFGDVDRDLDAVAVEVDLGGLHRDVVLAAVVVLLGQFVLDLVELELVEGFAFGHADALEALEQVFFLDVLVAADGDLGDLRALLQRHHEDFTLARQLHVAEEAGLVQGADRLLGAVAGQRVALLDRQVGEHRARCDARQAFDADVGDREGIERGRVLDGEPGEQE